MSEIAAGANVNAEPITLSHASLPAAREGSFQKECPVCKKGVLLVYRDDKTFMLRNLDRCIYCAQQFVYTDKTINGERVIDVIHPS